MENKKTTSIIALVLAAVAVILLIVALILSLSRVQK